mgnify:FL=1
MDGRALLALLILMEELDSVRHLMLAHCLLSPTHMRVVEKTATQGFRHLQTLSLRGNMIGDEGCMNLCRALEECEALQEMDLSENALTDVGAVHLGALLLQRGNIHSLILRSKAQVLQGHPRRTLHPMQSVGRVRVEVDEFMAEFPAPHFHSYFHDLAAHAQRVPRCGNRISDVGICALLSCVAVPERPTGLTSLDLCGNPASMKSVLFLCEKLSKRVTLYRIGLTVFKSGQCLPGGSKVFLALAEAIKFNKNVVHADLGDVLLTRYAFGEVGLEVAPGQALWPYWEIAAQHLPPQQQSRMKSASRSSPPRQHRSQSAPRSRPASSSTGFREVNPVQAPEALHSHPSGLETPPRSAPVQSPSGGRTRSGSFRDHTKSSLLRQAVTASEFPNATPEDGAALGARSRSRSNSQLSSNSASSAVAPSTQRASLSVSQLDEVSYRQDLAATMQNGVWHEESPWLQRHHPASAMWGSEVNSSSSAGPALIDPFEETVSSSSSSFPNAHHRQPSVGSLMQGVAAMKRLTDRTLNIVAQILVKSVAEFKMLFTEQRLISYQDPEECQNFAQKNGGPQRWLLLADSCFRREWLLYKIAEFVHQQGEVVEKFAEKFATAVSFALPSEYEELMAQLEQLAGYEELLKFEAQKFQKLRLSVGERSRGGHSTISPAIGKTPAVDSLQEPMAQLLVTSPDPKPTRQQLPVQEVLEQRKQSSPNMRRMIDLPPGWIKVKEGDRILFRNLRDPMASPVDEIPHAAFLASSTVGRSEGVGAELTVTECRPQIPPHLAQIVAGDGEKGSSLSLQSLDSAGSGSINFRGSTPNVVVTSATPSSVQQAPSPGPKHSDGVEASSPLGSPHEPAAGIRQVEASASLSGQNSPADEDSFSEVSSIVGGSGQRPVQVPSLDMATALAGNRTCVVPEHRDLGDGGRPLVICKPKNAPVHHAVGADVLNMDDDEVDMESDPVSSTTTEESSISEEDESAEPRGGCSSAMAQRLAARLASLQEEKQESAEEVGPAASASTLEPQSSSVSAVVPNKGSSLSVGTHGVTLRRSSSWSSSTPSEEIDSSDDDDVTPRFEYVPSGHYMVPERLARKGRRLTAKQAKQQSTGDPQPEKDGESQPVDPASSSACSSSISSLSPGEGDGDDTTPGDPLALLNGCPLPSTASTASSSSSPPPAPPVAALATGSLAPSPRQQKPSSSLSPPPRPAVASSVSPASSEGSSSTPSLSNLWDGVQDAAGDLYYVNRTSKEALWHLPEGAVYSGVVLPQDGDGSHSHREWYAFPWEICTMQNGERYYHNVETSKTLWEPPFPLPLNENSSSSS